MNKYSITNEKTGVVYKRITKKEARKLFDSGNALVVIPCKLAPFTPWHMECIIDGFNKESEDRTFDRIINAFIFYNCNYETGYYPAFYIPEC